MGKILKYRIPLQCSMSDIFYYEDELEARYSKVSLQSRIDIFLVSHNIYPEEQYPHLIDNYKPEEE